MRGCPLGSRRSAPRLRTRRLCCSRGMPPSPATLVRARIEDPVWYVRIGVASMIGAAARLASEAGEFALSIGAGAFGLSGDLLHSAKDRPRHKTSPRAERSLIGCLTVVLTNWFSAWRWSVRQRTCCPETSSSRRLPEIAGVHEADRAAVLEDGHRHVGRSRTAGSGRRD